MKIAILGYGKMGKAIEEIAAQKGHEISFKIDVDDQLHDNIDLSVIDVAIEFSTPEQAAKHVQACFDKDVPVVSGTTGWNEELEAARKYCIENSKSFFYASNFSVGANIFFRISSEMALMMNDQDQYDPVITEVHHTEKIDSPSGTAILLAEDMIKNLGRKSRWTNEESTDKEDLVIQSLRKVNVAGTHTVNYKSDVDDIEIKHTAHSRAGFAEGALHAAEWLIGKEGFFDMNDLLNFRLNKR
ncbi:MAG: 4-hydroxy-tetrahydrodipicolinate reductase [Bacteroidetes bacterium]|nr:4-hydroxy-tetrahydrodipicolinate reductase [Bacteroidota bacterium]